LYEKLDDAAAEAKSFSRGCEAVFSAQRPAADCESEANRENYLMINEAKKYI
jgi:hypothetical protein